VHIPSTSRAHSNVVGRRIGVHVHDGRTSVQATLKGADAVSIRRGRQPLVFFFIARPEIKNFNDLKWKEDRYHTARIVDA